MRRSPTFALEHASKRVETYNISLEDQINVEEIAKITTEEMNLKDIYFATVAESVEEEAEKVT